MEGGHITSAVEGLGQIRIFTAEVVVHISLPKKFAYILNNRARVADTSSLRGKKKLD